MANNWWENDPVVQSQEPSAAPTNNWWENDPVAKSATGNWWEKDPVASAPTESGGFFGSAATALKERAATALPAAKLYTGLGDQKAAADELLKHKQDSESAYKQTEFSDIGEAFKQGQFTEALGKTVDKFKEVAGSSLGAMAPAMVAGAGAAAAAPVALPAAAVGTAAFGLVALGSYIADNLGRQKEEQEAKGKRYEDVNRLDATIAAAGQTALDVFGFKFFKPLGALVGIEGKAAADKAAMEIVESATRPGAYKRAVARGTASGIAFEVPQEVTQSVLERWQAGLAVNPFTDPSAAKEYMEAAGGAMMLGGPMGAYSGAAQTFKARRSDEGKALLEETKNGSLYERLGKGEEDAGKAVTIPDRTGDGVVVPPSSELPNAGESVQPDTGGVVPTGRDAGITDGGEGIPSGSLDTFRTNYKDVRDELLSLMANQRPTEADMRIMKTVARNLNEVIDENAALIKDPKLIEQLRNPMFDGTSIIDAIASQPGGQPRAMQGDMFGSLRGATRREQGAEALAGTDAEAKINELNASRDRIQKNYDSGKFDAAWAMRLAEQFGFTKGQAAQNPDAVAQAYMQKAFADIEQALGEVQRKSRGMQGDMFTNMPPAEPKKEPSLADFYDRRNALMAKLDEVQQQENDLSNEQEKLRDKGIYEGKGASEYLDEINEIEKQRQAKNAEFDETLKQIDALDATRSKFRGMQGDMFTNMPPAEPAAPAKKKTRMEFDPVSNKMVEVEEETATDANRAEETQSGQLIRGFFDALKVDSESKGQADRHANSKNTAADALLEYDILEPGQQTTQGLEIALDFLASKLGGVENMASVVEQLRNATPGQQSAILTKFGLPDLTTTRGMDSFSKQAQKYLEGIHQRGEGVKITPRRTTPSFVTGEFKGVMPHETRTKTTEEQIKERQASQETGKPRRPEVVHKEREFVVQEPKLISAVRNLFQTLSSVKARHITPQMIAAKTYLNNGNRESFIDALNALAFDLAYAEQDKARYGKIRDYGAGWQYVGEGGQFAQYFKEWIESNLSKNTTDVLNDMVEHYKKNYDSEISRREAIEKFQRENDRYKDARSQVRKADKKAGKKTVSSDRMSKLYETERKDIEQDYFDNLPTRGLLHEMHPDMRRLLREGDTKGVLEIMAASPKGNKYYAALAQRLIDAGITAETKVIGPDSVISLSGSTQIEETFNNYLKALEDTVTSVFAEKEHADLINGLRSNNVTKIGRALMAMQEGVKASSNKSQVEMLDQASTMFVDEFNWNGKYDPNTDTIYVREGAGKLTNHLFLHEAIHAAASILIDNGKNLTGIQKVGYDRLVELFEHSKKQLAHLDLSEAEQYALTDLHEFVSESLTNPELQAKLRAIEYAGTPLTLWNQFTAALTKLFGVSPKDTESNVMVEVMRATDTMLTDPASTADLSFASTPKASRTARLKVVPPGLQNQPSTVQRLMTANSWTDVKDEIPYLLTSAKANTRPVLLGALTLRQIDDLVRNRIPQVSNFIKVTEEFLSRKNRILRESGEIAKHWERLQSTNPDMSRQLGKVMHMATIKGVDPDKASTFQKNNEVELMQNWNKLTPMAKQIYREVRDFYDKRYSEYKNVMNKRIIQMRQLGVSEATITEIRNEFEQSRRKGPYFPLMRHGRFWYQVGTGNSREYYMFESAGQKERHIQERLKRNPELESTIKEGSQYSEQMNTHAKESSFLKNLFDAIDSATFAGGAAEKQDMKDAMYQNYLSNQPERSFRHQFMHRNNVAGYSEDALRNFSSSSFHMAYQLARFEHAPDLFSNVEAARVQLKDRIDANQEGFDPKVSQENNELSDYVAEMNERMKLMLNPTDTGTIPSLLSNVGFIWYLTAPASAIVNVLGGMMIGLPTLVGQYVKSNPQMSYGTAVLKSLGQMKNVAGQIIATGFDVERGKRIRDNYVHFPTLDRAKNMSASDREAYDRFVADGLIDITAAYDQSGLAAAPTESYLGVRHRTMEALTSLFHNAERFNREIMAMSSFRAAMEKRKDYKDQALAMEESISEAKDVTNRSMFDYSTANKPRYFQHPVARVVLQFKQFPQQMTFFLAHNMYNMFKGASPEVRREARARFVGTMGMAAIFSGGTGVWGFSTVASIINAVINGMADEDEEEEPFDFELEFVNWAVETFGSNLGTLLTRGVGNAAGIDLASRVKLDDMWFRDSRKNQDEVEALQTFLVDLLGPSVGLAINVAEAAKLYNEGHADRALEMISPAFIKNPLVAARYANEGVNTLRGDPLIEEVGPFDLLMQSLGIRSAQLAEIQYYNITVKGQEQEILKKRQSLLDLYAISIISNDSDALETAFDNIDKFNTKHPSVFIPADSLTKSVEGRFKKSSQTDHGLYIDPKLMGVLGKHTYLD